MMIRNNHNSDIVYPEAIRANEEIGSAAANGAEQMGLVLGVLSFGLLTLVFKFDKLFVGHLRKWCAHYYDKLGFKFMN